MISTLYATPMFYLLLWVNKVLLWTQTVPSLAWDLSHIHLDLCLWEVVRAIYISQFSVLFSLPWVSALLHKPCKLLLVLNDAALVSDLSLSLCCGTHQVGKNEACESQRNPFLFFWARGYACNISYSKLGANESINLEWGKKSQHIPKIWPSPIDHSLNFSKNGHF